METMTLTMKSLAPLLMHNGQLADPMNPHAQALRDAVKVYKKNKTDAAYIAAAKAEFMGGLYLDEKLEPCIPGEMIEAMLCEAARKDKQGKEAKAGLIVEGNFPLIYDGPRNPEKLWEAGLPSSVGSARQFVSTKPVKIGKNKVMRTRAIFIAWACRFLVHFNPTLLNGKDIIRFAIKAGLEIGIGDYRPRYGRFEAEAAK